MTRALVIVAVLAGVAHADAHADAVKDRAAIARLGDAYAPTGKLGGAARAERACRDAGAFDAAWQGLPQQRAPRGAVLDDDAWKAAVNDLGLTIDRMAAVCKAPGRQLPAGGSGVDTAEAVAGRLDAAIHLVIDGAKPRTLPAAVAKLETTLAATRSNRAACAQHAKLARLMPAVGKPPAGADADAWGKTVAAIQRAVDELGTFACGKPRGADEDIAGALVSLHDRVFALVLLVPPRG